MVQKWFGSNSSRSRCGSSIMDRKGWKGLIWVGCCCQITTRGVEVAGRDCASSNPSGQSEKEKWSKQIMDERLKRATDG